MSTNTDRIAEIQALLASGVQTHTVDGHTTTINHQTLREELRRLQIAEGQIRARDKVTNIFLG